MLTTKSAADSLTKWYGASPIIILQSVLGLWQQDIRLEAFANLESSPLKCEFFRNQGLMYRSLTSMETVSNDRSLEDLVEFLRTVSSNINRIEIAVEASALCTSICRDLLSSPGRYRNALPCILRWNTQILVLQQTLDPQAIVRDHLDMYYRLLDHCVATMTRLVDPAMWSDWPIIKMDSEPFTLTLFETAMKRSTKDQVSSDVAFILLEEVLPHAPSLINDPDRYGALMGQIVSGLLVPVFRGSIRYRFHYVFQHNLCLENIFQA